jgi:hypothetical protein
MDIEEKTRIGETIEVLSRPVLRNWLLEHGMLCVVHGAQLARRLPEALQKTIEKTLSRNVQKLEQDLQEFLPRAKTGN